MKPDFRSLCFEMYKELVELQVLCGDSFNDDYFDKLCGLIDRADAALKESNNAKTRRRFISFERRRDINGYEVLDAVCEEGRAWTCYWQTNSHEYSEWSKLPELPEITE